MVISKNKMLVRVSLGTYKHDGIVITLDDFTDSKQITITNNENTTLEDITKTLKLKGYSIVEIFRKNNSPIFVKVYPAISFDEMEKLRVIPVKHFTL